MSVQLHYPAALFPTDEKTDIKFETELETKGAPQAAWTLRRQIFCFYRESNLYSSAFHPTAFPTKDAPEGTTTLRRWRA